jgi:PAS domain S-box-containing protein
MTSPDDTAPTPLPAVAQPAVPRWRVGHAFWVVTALTLLFAGTWLAGPWPEMAGIASYAPLHTFLETFSIIVAAFAFAIAWFGQRHPPLPLLVLGCALLAVALLDFAHVLSYAGMPQFVTPSDPEKAIAFWLAARYAESAGLLYAAVASWEARATSRQRQLLLAAALAGSALVYWVVLFHLHVLPRTFIPGEGLTTFKIAAEYGVVLIHLVAAVVLVLRRHRHPAGFDFASLLAAAVIIGLSELYFTLYAQVTDLYNVLGHIYKIIAYGFIAKVLFVDVVRAPYEELLRSRWALDEANRLNAALYEQNPTAIQLYRSDGVSLGCNPAFEVLHDVSGARLAGLARLRTDAALVRAFGTERLERLIRGELEHLSVDHMRVDGARTGQDEGRARWIAASLFPIRDRVGNVLRLVAMQKDVTEQREVELTLARERDFIATVLDSVGALVLVLDEQGRITRMNRAAERATGLRFDRSWRTRAWQRLTPPEELDLFQSACNRLRGAGGTECFEHWWTCLDGERRLIAWTCVGLADERGGADYIVCSGMDITRERRAQEEARHHLRELGRVSRIGLLGEMASAMAHELNQPLAAVVNYTQGCVRRVRAGDTDSAALLDALEQAAGQAQRAGEIIRNIRGFIRKGEAHAKPLDINALVRATADLARPLMTQHSVDLALTLAENSPIGVGDSLQIQQVILNLLRNAAEALEAIPAQHRKVVLATAAANGQVRISVADTGPGLDPMGEEEIFAPFYTTKEQGMGLGLALCQSIVEAHDGRLEAHNRPEGGACFVVTLPRAATLSPNDPGPRAGGTGAPSEWVEPSAEPGAAQGPISA